LGFYLLLPINTQIVPTSNISFYRLSLITAFLFAFAISDTHAQILFPRKGEKSRFEFGVTANFASAKLTSTVPKYDTRSTILGFPTIKLKDTTIDTTPATEMGIGVYIGNSWFIRKLGRKSILAFHGAILAQVYTYDKLSPIVNENSEIVNNFFANPVGLAVSKLSVPLSLDVKYGTDALCKRRYPVGFTFGAGAMPQYNMVAFANASGGVLKNEAVLGFAPFAKGEFSFFSAACFKVKLFASLGTAIKLVDSRTEISPTQTNVFQLTENANFTACVSWLPFSFMWKKVYWWNDFDTRKPYEDD
jgi:hypothetical protein